MMKPTHDYACVWCCYACSHVGLGGAGWIGPGLCSAEEKIGRGGRNSCGPHDGLNAIFGGKDLNVRAD
ncbi:hypothetical protein KFK09_004205 [Dendrobium nobile]|uniref:Uncharacterized protein n=1 Tax=Dendrobium nobile TaxID=94219 RepID=A0A8T3C550_DENNO|nr:hypothetical protein KFK09_004205 [Dendrobium nobile]